MDTNTPLPALTETQEIALGYSLIALFNLQPVIGRYHFNTSHGTKTPIGLARTIIRLIEEAKEIK